MQGIVSTQPLAMRFFMRVIQLLSLSSLAEAARRPSGERVEPGGEKSLSMPGAKTGFATSAQRRNIVWSEELERESFRPCRQICRANSRFGRKATRARRPQMQLRSLFPYRKRQPATCNTCVARSSATCNTHGAPRGPKLVASSRATCNTGVANSTAPDLLRWITPPLRHQRP